MPVTGRRRFWIASQPLVASVFAALGRNSMDGFKARVKRYYAREDTAVRWRAAEIARTNPVAACETHHLERALEIWRGVSVLDAGGGAGRLSIAMQGWGANVVLSDFSPPMVAEARVNLEQPGQICLATVEELPFADGTFDAAVCTILNHVAEPPQVVEQLARVLKPGGALVLIFNNWASLGTISDLAIEFAGAVRRTTPSHKLNRPGFHGDPVS